MGTPHILAHLTLAPGERREVPLDLPPGPYRFRTLEPGPEVALDHAGGPPPSVRYDGAAIAAEPGPGRGTGLVLANASPHLRTFVVEDRSWVADALTGDRLTAMQPFRDLFSDQVLRPGDEVGIGRIAILFSDLRGSTALYERIGDAAAYRRVREHFGYLAAIVRQHEGAIVKTIGDAVMAAFADPAQGVAAALAMQDHIGDLNRSSAGPPLVLKLGVHAGPCIAVTLNDRLDYFGRAVNLAARLLDVSQGADVVLSADLAAEPKVAALLEGRSLKRGKTELRGFVGAVPFLQVAVGQDRWKGLRTPDRRARKSQASSDRDGVQAWTAASSCSACQVQGSRRSSSWALVRPEIMRSSMTVSHARSSTLFRTASASKTTVFEIKSARKWLSFDVFRRFS